jgi:hypothetical protein
MVALLDNHHNQYKDYLSIDLNLVSEEGYRSAAFSRNKCPHPLHKSSSSLPSWQRPSSSSWVPSHLLYLDLLFLIKLDFLIKPDCILSSLVTLTIKNFNNLLSLHQRFSLFSPLWRN